jgi:hypothetical protein
MKPVLFVVAGAALAGALLVAPTLLQGVGGSADAATASGFATTSLSVASAKTYKNCTALNKKYPHGVGKPGASDKVRGSTKPVTNFTVSASLYKANKKSDRDGDGVACEKR